MSSRRKAVEKKNELLHKLEAHLQGDEPHQVFSRFADDQRLLNSAGLHAGLSQLRLELNRDEIKLLLASLTDDIHHAITYDEFRNIVKARRRNMTACRQSIDENRGAFKKMPVCTTFKAPVLKHIGDGRLKVEVQVAVRLDELVQHRPVLELCVAV